MAVKKWKVVFCSDDPYMGATVTFEAERAEILNPREARQPHVGSPIELIGNGLDVDGKFFMCKDGVSDLEEVTE